MSDEVKRAVETAQSVRSVVVDVECPHCNGKRRLPGGKYVDQGEVIACQICEGRGTVRASIPLGMLYDLLMGNIPKPAPSTSRHKDGSHCSNKRCRRAHLMPIR